MAFPTSILLPNNIVMTIAGALSRTMTPRWLHGPMRRDTVSAAKLGNSYQPVVMETAAQTVPALDIGIESIVGTKSAVVANSPIQLVVDSVGPLSTTTYADTPTINVLDGAITMKAIASVLCAKFDEDDDLNHIGSRPDPRLVEMFEYWSSATTPGIAQTIIADTTNGSNRVLVGCNNNLTVGQKFTSSAAFPIAAEIQAIEYVLEKADSATEGFRYGTYITVSREAGASTTELLTFTGSDLIAWHTPEGDIAAGGSFALLT